MKTISKSKKETDEEKRTLNALILSTNGTFWDMETILDSSLVNIKEGLIVVSVKVSWDVFNLFLTFPCRSLSGWNGVPSLFHALPDNWEIVLNEMVNVILWSCLDRAEGHNAQEYEDEL